MSKMTKLNSYVDYASKQMYFTLMVGLFTRVAVKAGKQVLQDLNNTPIMLRRPPSM